MTTTPLILLIEDDADMRHLLRSLLEPNGYRVLEAVDGEEGIRQVAECSPNLVLLDVCLPDVNGQTVLERLRSWTTTPVVVVSGEDSSQTKVNLLDAGADDYLTKPFSGQELLARVRVGLRHARRIQEEYDEPVFVNGDLVVDRATRRVFHGDTEIELTPTEYRLLLTFVKNPDRVLTHEQLLEEVWGADCVGRDHYVRVYMAHLRRKLEKDAASPKYLVTEVGVGYRLCCV